MSVGQRLRQRRMELNMTQTELARRLGVTPAVVSNYESGQNPVRSELLEKLIQVLDVEPNVLFQDIYQGAGFPVSGEERRLVERYRGLTTVGRQTLQSVAEALEAYQADLDLPAPEVRQIPLYRCPAAAGFAAPVFGEDFDYIEVTGDVPRGAEFAVSPTSGTAPLSTSTATPWPAGTWGSSVWTVRCSASSTSGTVWGWCTSSP